MLKNRLWWLLAIIPAYVLVPWAPLSGPFDTNDILPVSVGILCALLLWQSREHLSLSLRPWLALSSFGFLMFCAHSLGGHGSFDLGALSRTAGRMGLFACIGAALALSQEHPVRHRLQLCFTFVVVFQALFGTVAALTGYCGPLGIGVVDYAAGHYPADGWARAQGTFGGARTDGVLFVNRANFYSAYLTIGLFVVLKTLERRTWQLGAAISVVLAGIVASGTRMSLLAAVLGLCVFALARRGNVRWFGAAAVTGMLVFTVPVIRNRFLSGFSDRLTLWGQALEVIKTSPWLGVGDSRYVEVLASLKHLDNPILHTPHHSILFATASYGVVIGLCLILFYAWLIHYSWVCRQRQPLLLAMVLAFVCHDMTNNLFFVPEVALSFWIAWALLDPGEGTASD